jgi:Polyketide cyclase / dehydrase and lipid transport
VPSVSATQLVAAPLPVVEAAWYDTSRWADWIVGLESVDGAHGGWPSSVGATVTWRSNPAGRGVVSERVVEHAPGDGQRLAVVDDLIEGEQSVAFALADGGVQVTLTLDFRRRRGGLFTALVDQFFSRRTMHDALALTLERFAAGVGAQR